MALTLVTGPAKAAKAGELLSGFRDQTKAGNSPILVVPTAADRDVYELELLESGALIGGRVVTWERFVTDLSRRVGVHGRVIGPIRRRLIAREIVTTALSDGQLSALAASAAAPGFPQALERLILEHSRALIDPSRLEQQIAASNQRLAAELTQLLDSYFARLDTAGLLDRDLQARSASEELAKNTGLWSGEPVFIYGFSDLTAVQIEVIRLLASQVEVAVSLPTEMTRPVGVGNLVAARLRARAELDGQVNEVFMALAEGDSSTLPGLANRLFTDSDDGSVIDDGVSLQILTGSGSRATAELAAGAVLDLLESGIAPEQIAVVRPRSEEDALLASILELSGIEVSRPESAELGASTLGRALLGLCRAAFDPESATADDAIVWIRATAGLDGALAVDRIEAELRRAGATRAKDALSIWARQSGQQLTALDQLRKHQSKKELAESLAAAATALMNARLVPNGQQVGRDVLFDASVVSSVSKAAVDLAEIFERSDPKPMIEELAALEIDVSVGASRPGAVQISDPSSIRARSADAIVVLGLEHGLFPASPAGDPFLGDLPADRLAASAEPQNADDDPRLFSSAARQQAGERERFVACLARARKRVVLVRRIRDDAGAAVSASPFLDETLRLLGRDLKQISEPDDVRLAGAVAPVSADDHRSQLRSEALKAQASRHPQLPAELGSPARDCIADQREAVVSPSRLEAYCECPIGWLGQNLLKPAEMEPEGEPTFRGTAVHLALQKAVEAAIEHGDGRIEDRVMEPARKAIAAAIAESTEKGPKTLAAAIALKRAEMLSLTWLEAERDRDWPARAIQTEFTFGREGIDPLDLGSGLKLAGTVDRVDVIGEGDERLLLVRDYKSGIGVWSHTKWEESRKLQPALYMLAAIEFLGGKPAAALYESIKSQQVTGAIVEGTPGEATVSPARSGESKDGVTSSEMIELIEAARKRALQAVKDIEEGQLGSDPSHCGGGYGCRYPWLCGGRR
ncbi:MAG: PD-(D/E)XK nuclease family protein [Solirubrobacterales bacterium]|nr:PD-(D/E)XK nuclease family protein [Solirubrobacterales bacterium]